MEKVTVKVTKADIRNGHAGSIMYCPIAKAAARAFGEREDDGYVTVGSEDLTVGYTRHPLPERARDFVRAFDNFAPVKPFQFTIKLLD